MFFCGSFTKPVRIEIKERANGVSELTGENSRPLVCAHLRHQGGRKTRGRFDYSENGLLVTDIEHLAHHQLFKFIPEMLGLCTKRNNYAIHSLVNDTKNFNEINRIPYHFSQQKYDLGVKTWIKLIHKEPQILGLTIDKNDAIISTLIKEIIIPGEESSTFEDILIKPWDELPT